MRMCGPSTSPYEGTVTGDLIATTSIVVAETSQINGNLYSPTVTLREGAKFTGRIDMSGKAQIQAKGHAQARADSASTSQTPETPARHAQA